MSLNPIETTKNINQSYVEYLSSLFFLKNKDLADQAKQLLQTPGSFIKGPFIEITPPFRTGANLNQLMAKGIMSSEFKKLEEHFPLERPLYEHQEKAVQKVISEKRNIVVATGTGSGKTECFLYPIVDYLMKQNEAGNLDPGVRALLLYPMNALANDQMKRLRELLKDYPDITFGRYTGETLTSKSAAEDKFKKMNPDAERLQNELLSREEMRETPPHIMLTNYAMLEYLLLRPDDNVFFDGEYAGEWKFIVLDEAHTYRGSKGTEISMLLQRLKDRVVNGERDHIRCIATSATLGGGKEAYKEVAEYASGIFHEEFSTDDIIEASRIEVEKDYLMCRWNQSEYYEKLYKLVTKNSENEQKLNALREIAKEQVPDIQDQIMRAEEWEEVLYYLLKDDRNVVKLQLSVKRKPKLLVKRHII